MPTVDEVVKKYIEIRDRKAEIAKRQSAELVPLNDAMANIEKWLMDQMNTLGVDSFKTAHGTPYKANSNSVKLTDAGAFKGHVFAPAVEGINNYLSGTGHTLQPVDLEALLSILLQMPKWDMVDFRAGKTGVLGYLESNEALPPGVSVETTAVINVRRS